MPTQPDLVDATIVSCDIVDHGSAPEDRQFGSITAINELVHSVIAHCGQSRVIWASGGDGGHVAFIGEELLQATLRFAAELAEWSERDSVPLRITVHRGPVGIFQGADGRPQLFGRTMNESGSMVNFGVPGRILASSEFTRYFLEQRDRIDDSQLRGLVLDSERTIYLKHFNAYSLHQLRRPESAPPEWSMVCSDLRRLHEASRQRLDWQSIYHSKRLLQVNSNHSHVKRVLSALNPLRLGNVNDDHALFVSMSRETIKRIVLESQLVERESGDLICEKGDIGDAMFVVLKGQVGVVTGRVSEPTSAPADIRLGEGNVVGELALGLQRPRTAALQAIGPTALLAIDDPTYKRLVEYNEHVRDSLERLVIARALEHIFRNTDYLADPQWRPDAELDVGKSANHWPNPWTALEDHTTLIPYEPDDAHNISVTKRAELAGPGLYILAGGQLVEHSEKPGARKTLAGDTFDLLYVNLPRQLVHASHEYKVDPRGPAGRISILRIRPDGLKVLAEAFGERARYYPLVERLRRRLTTQMMFDVFISYCFDDTERVQRWRVELERAGLRVYVNVQSTAMVEFATEIDIAVAEARVFMLIISRAASRSDYVARELERRRSVFPERANILSVSYDQASAIEMTDGVGLLSVGANREQEATAIRDAIQLIESVRDGAMEPPMRSSK